MLERANRKLGLERAMNADRANDGLAAAEGGKASKSNGPPQVRDSSGRQEMGYLKAPNSRSETISPVC